MQSRINSHEMSKIKPEVFLSWFALSAVLDIACLVTAATFNNHPTYSAISKFASFIFVADTTDKMLSQPIENAVPVGLRIYNNLYNFFKPEHNDAVVAQESRENKDEFVRSPTMN